MFLFNDFLDAPASQVVSHFLLRQVKQIRQIRQPKWKMRQMRQMCMFEILLNSPFWFKYLSSFIVSVKWLTHKNTSLDTLAIHGFGLKCFFSYRVWRLSLLKTWSSLELNSQPWLCWPRFFVEYWTNLAKVYLEQFALLSCYL